MNVRMEPLDAIPPWTRAIHGHFRARDHNQHFPGAQRIAWLRHPVQRVVSEYEHHRRRTDPYNRLAGFVGRGASLREFAEHPAARNTQTRMLDGLPLSAFAFVGISECLDDELPRLARATGLKLPGGRWSNPNPAKEKLAAYDLAPDVYDLILELNREDVALYERACAGATAAPVTRSMVFEPSGQA